MRLKFNANAIVLLIGLALLFPTPAPAEEARLININVSNDQDNLLLYFTLEGAFREQMESTVMTGVPATFSFYVSLHRVRDLWFDKKIADLKLTHTIKYDNLKKVFTVKRSWKEEEPIVTASFEEAQRLMTEIDNLAIYPLTKLSKGRQYQIRTMAEVSKITLPFSLHYVVFFVSFWDFETDWYTIDFIY